MEIPQASTLLFVLQGAPRGERVNANRYRMFKSNKLRYEQRQADIRSLEQRVTMINAAIISRR